MVGTAESHKKRIIQTWCVLLTRGKAILCNTPRLLLLTRLTVRSVGTCYFHKSDHLQTKDRTRRAWNVMERLRLINSYFACCMT